LGHYSPWYQTLIYAAFIDELAGGNQDIKALIIYGILGLFFSSGISLVRTTNES
jgi:hypothetical protein